MHNIEDKICKNIEQFNDAEPQEGHFDRFLDKMEKSESETKKSMLLNFGFLWRVAASLLILLAVAVLYNQIEKINLTPNKHTEDLPAEIIEATDYYASLNREKLSTLSEMTAQGEANNEIYQLAIEEVATIDQNSSELRKKYSETRDERVIDAIITNYRVLGDLLDHIILRVNESN